MDNTKAGFIPGGKTGSLVLALTGLFLSLALPAIPPAFAGASPFRDLHIEAPFRDVLIPHAEFMATGGAEVISAQNGLSAVVGIGKSVIDGTDPAKVLEARRKAEIRARTAVLALRDGIEIKTSRGFDNASGPVWIKGKKVALSTCFQVTESRVAGIVKRMPIIGAWRASKRNVLYVAVGRILKGSGRPTGNGPPVSTVGKQMDPRALLNAIIHASPVLRTHGGIRGFYLPDGRKALVAVGATKLKGSVANAQRIAKIKAMRSVLGHKKGITLSTVECLTDGEILVLGETGAKHEMLSSFISVEEARVSGFIKAMPVVAQWEDTRAGLYYVAIGKLF